MKTTTNKPPVKTRHPAELVGIYRLHDPNRGGYYLSVVLRRDGESFSKLFCENRCGGQDQTMLVAQAWRDRIVQANPAMSMAAFCAIVRSNNTSGVPGIYRSSKKNRSSNGKVNVVEYWIARIPLPDGKSRIRNFSIRRFGEDGAKEHAIQARLDGLEELDGIVFRGRMQPELVSGEEQMIALDKVLRLPEECRAEREAQRLQQLAVREAELQRRADKLAQTRQKHSDAVEKPTNRTGEPYIGRNFSPSGKSGNWRVSVERGGKKYRKTFADSVYGSEDAALKAAKVWRNDVFAEKTKVRRSTVTSRVNSTNTSGVTGVFLLRELPGNVASAWAACSPKILGRPGRTRKFSIAKYGAESAYSLAVQARKEFVAEVAGKTYLHHRAAKKMQNILAEGAAKSEE